MATSVIGAPISGSAQTSFELQIKGEFATVIYTYNDRYDYYNMVVRTQDHESTSKIISGMELLNPIPFFSDCSIACSRPNETFPEVPGAEVVSQYVFFLEEPDDL